MIEYTRVRLSRWGQWCRHGSAHLGYPASAAFTHADEGDRCEWQGKDMPPDIAEVEEIVSRMAWPLRQPLVVVYAKPGPLWLKAAWMGISRRTLKRRLATAENWVHLQLT